jgi:hypothetical protein
MMHALPATSTTAAAAFSRVIGGIRTEGQESSFYLASNGFLRSNMWKSVQKWVQAFPHCVSYVPMMRLSITD